MKQYLVKLKGNTLVQRVLRAIIFGAGGAIVAKGILIIFNIILARILNTTEYGVYSIVNNTVQTFTIFAGAGLGSTLSRYVALYRNKDKKLAGIIIKTLLVFNVFISIAVSLVMFFAASWISALISEEVDISNYLRITSLTIFFTSVALILQGTLQGFEKYNKIATYQLVSSVAMLVIGVIIAYHFKTVGAIIALLIQNLLMAILFFMVLKNVLIKKRIKLKFCINGTVKEAIRNVAIPALLSSIFVVPIVWVTNSIFTKSNSYEEFAAFSVCLQWFTILNYIPQQLGQVRPIYTQLFDENKMVEFKKISYKMILFSALFTFIMSTLLGIFSGLLLKMYGDYYTDYSLPFIVMLIAAVMYSIQSQFGSIFYAIGRIWLSFILNVVWAIIFIVCFFILQENGAIGYALAYLISYLLYSAISFIFFRITVKRKKLSGDTLQ
ncbi:oligosaccharide flippase family protein [Candidatus Saccharibacteria bacterium]|nr:oligosaccharide flippase family protein [Candidatus Saccharibacteria bacterium]